MLDDNGGGGGGNDGDNDGDAVAIDDDGFSPSPCDVTLGDPDALPGRFSSPQAESLSTDLGLFFNEMFEPLCVLAFCNPVEFDAKVLFPLSVCSCARDRSVISSIHAPV